VFPVERQRLEVKRWIATLIARPAVKMRYGLLLVSETQGVGKTTLGHMLTEVIGRHNACSGFPSSSGLRWAASHGSSPAPTAAPIVPPSW
jgi:hypothetical protein